MNSKFTLVIALCALGAYSPLSAQALNVPALGSPSAPAAAVAPVSPVAATTTYSETQVLESLGWYMGKDAQIDTLLLTPAQLEAFQRGFAIAAADRDAPVDLNKIGPQIKAFTDGRITMYKAKLKKDGMAETDKLFASLKAQSGVKFTTSGLAYEILKAGTGANAKATDTSTVHYTATYANGEMFDTSKQSQQPGVAPQPVEMAIADSLPGLQEGLQLINKGGRIKLYIPPKLGFGEDGVDLSQQGGPTVPPGTTLVFDIEVQDIKPTPGPASLSPKSAAPPVVSPLGK